MINLKDSGKELYGFLFNDTFLIVEGYDSLHNDVFKAKNGKFQQLQLYKQVSKIIIIIHLIILHYLLYYFFVLKPILLENITVVQSKIINSGSDCSFQIIVGDKEYIFKTSNPTLK